MFLLLNSHGYPLDPIEAVLCFDALMQYRQIMIADTTLPSRHDKHPALKDNQVLFKTYTIVRMLGEGGFGRVYLVHDALTGHHYAVKILRDHPNDIALESSFFRELYAWIDLPIHPNLTTCRFIRSIENQIAICCEYVNGGTLETSIQSGRLNTLEAILDAGIQLGRGLQVSHDWGVIHQDIKPANALVTVDGVVKITDFGLARSLPMSTGTDQDLPSMTPLVSSVGMTPAYCSPEQASGRKITFQSDLWNWAVTILHMITGTITWKIGILAPHVVENLTLHSPSRITIPSKLIHVLERCFKPDPADRWRRIGDAVEVLEDLYREYTGTQYPRSNVEPIPKAASLEERAGRSLVSGSRWQDPQINLMEFLERAGRADVGISGTQKPRSNYGKILFDLEINQIYARVAQEQFDKGMERTAIECIQAMYQKGLILEALMDSEGAEHAYATGQLYLRLTPMYERSEAWIKQAVNLFVDHGNLLSSSDEMTRSLEIYDNGLRFLEELSATEGYSRSLLDLLYTKITYNKATVLISLRQMEPAERLLDEGIEIKERLLSEGRFEEQTIAIGYQLGAKGLALYEQNRYSDALPYLQQADAWYYRVYDPSIPIQAVKISRISNNLAMCYCKLNLVDESRAVFERTIAMLEPLEADSPDVRITKVFLITNFIGTHERSMSSLEMIRMYDIAIRILEELVYQSGYSNYQLELTRLKIWRLLTLTQIEPMDEEKKDALERLCRMIELRGTRHIPHHIRETLLEAREVLTGTGNDR